MTLDEVVDDLLEKYNMERSEEAEELGKLVADLQD